MRNQTRPAARIAPTIAHPIPTPAAAPLLTPPLWELEAGTVGATLLDEAAECNELVPDEGVMLVVEEVPEVLGGLDVVIEEVVMEDAGGGGVISTFLVITEISGWTFNGLLTVKVASKVPVETE